jgi:hypothetical protein
MSPLDCFVAAAPSLAVWKRARAASSIVTAGQEREAHVRTEAPAIHVQQS